MVNLEKFFAFEAQPGGKVVRMIVDVNKERWDQFLGLISYFYKGEEEVELWRGMSPVELQKASYCGQYTWFDEVTIPEDGRPSLMYRTHRSCRSMAVFCGATSDGVAWGDGSLNKARDVLFEFSENPSRVFAAWVAQTFLGRAAAEGMFPEVELPNELDRPEKLLFPNKEAAKAHLDGETKYGVYIDSLAGEYSISVKTERELRGEFLVDHRYACHGWFDSLNEAEEVVSNFLGDGDDYDDDHDYDYDDDYDDD
ncbi:MAG: hypothetical protein LBL08_03855 [Candidatus Nomurabacteria bacterium]|jgi:hypothetical protein|nr:hypothetical protein [Candidatus Nomurabacteria bacterium]